MSLVISVLALGQVGITSVGTAKNVTYTPNANIDVEVKMFGIQMKIFDDNSDPQEIDMNNVVLTSDNDQYRGTKLDLQTSFGLYHDGFEIFRRVFDGSNIYRRYWYNFYQCSKSLLCNW